MPAPVDEPYSSAAVASAAAAALADGCPVLPTGILRRTAGDMPYGVVPVPLIDRMRRGLCCIKKKFACVSRRAN